MSNFVEIMLDFAISQNNLFGNDIISINKPSLLLPVSHDVSAGAATGSSLHGHDDGRHAVD